MRYIVGYYLLENIDSLFKGQGFNPMPIHGFSVEVVGDNAHVTPVSPVDDMDGEAGFVPQISGKGVFKGTAGRVISLPRQAHYRLYRGKKDKPVKGLVFEDLDQVDTAVDLGGQGG